MLVFVSYLTLSFACDAFVFAAYSGSLARCVPFRTIPLPVQACAHFVATCFRMVCGTLCSAPVSVRCMVRDGVITFGFELASVAGAMLLFGSVDGCLASVLRIFGVSAVLTLASFVASQIVGNFSQARCLELVQKQRRLETSIMEQSALLQKALNREMQSQLIQSKKEVDRLARELRERQLQLAQSKEELCKLREDFGKAGFRCAQKGTEVENLKKALAQARLRHAEGEVGTEPLLGQSSPGNEMVQCAQGGLSKTASYGDGEMRFQFIQSKKEVDRLTRELRKTRLQLAQLKKLTGRPNAL